MANSLTIQLRPTRKYDKPSVANLFHNAGLSKATYWIKNPDSLISNLDLKNLTTRQAVNLWRKWEEEATNLVIKNKGKNPQEKQVLIEEGLMVIGKDVLEKDPKIFIKIFEEFKEWFEKKYNTKIVAYFFHNHEGYIDEKTGDFSTNLHIHFFFRNVDIFGNSVRRQIKKSDLSLFQDKIFEIGKKYIPNLERATNYKELGLKAPKHKSHREYRLEKNKQMQLKLSLIAKENRKLKEENKELLAKVKDLKEENRKIREQFKAFGAKREDYAILEQLVKDLKEKIKRRELTIKEMQEKFNQVLDELREKNAKLEEENLKLKQENKEFKDLIIKPENFNTTYELKEEIENLYIKNEEKLENTKKIANRNQFVINYLYDYDTETKQFDNIEYLEEENENFKNKIKSYKEINDKYLDTNSQQIEDYRDKFYLMQILSKRIDFLIKRLEELSKRLEILAKKVINKLLDQNKKISAEILINKIFKVQEQKDNKIKQNNYLGPKL